ncbi:transposase, partial [Rhizobium laguerreae]|uniref:transposase n=1 Tax=Rhizobium laguerreae TaxID=1076926 RepID=UPI001C909985
MRICPTVVGDVPTEDGTPIGEVCRKAGISDATFYNWRKKYAGLMPSEMKRLRQL